MLPVLLRENLVAPSRKSGKTQMYGFKRSSSRAKALESYFNETMREDFTGLKKDATKREQFSRNRIDKLGIVENCFKNWTIVCSPLLQIVIRMIPGFNTCKRKKYCLFGPTVFVIGSIYALNDLYYELGSSGTIV